MTIKTHEHYTRTFLHVSPEFVTQGFQPRDSYFCLTNESGIPQGQAIWTFVSGAKERAFIVDIKWQPRLDVANVTLTRELPMRQVLLVAERIGEIETRNMIYVVDDRADGENVRFFLNAEQRPKVSYEAQGPKVDMSYRGLPVEAGVFGATTHSITEPVSQLRKPTPPLAKIVTMLRDIAEEIERGDDLSWRLPRLEVNFEMLDSKSLAVDIQIRALPETLDSQTGKMTFG